MKKCIEGEAWFCRPEEVLESLSSLIQDTGSRIRHRGDCIEVDGPILKAIICRGGGGRIGRIEYTSCRILILSNRETCGRIKILLMRGGG